MGRICEEGKDRAGQRSRKKQKNSRLYATERKQSPASEIPERVKSYKEKAASGLKRERKAKAAISILPTNTSSGSGGKPKPGTVT